MESNTTPTATSASCFVIPASPATRSAMPFLSMVFPPWVSDAASWLPADP